MAKELELAFGCPECGKDVTIKANISPIELAPDVRSEIMPVGSIFVYRISSEQIKQFVIRKAKKIVPNVKVEVVPRYCERKRRKNNEPHRSYASLRIAFSDDILEGNSDNGWFGKVGETNTNIRIVQDFFDIIIKRYQYNRKEIDKWLSSYKTLETIEDTLGMTEAYLNDLRMYTTPRRVITANKEPWIIFSAAAENVIEDMLTNPETNQPDGRIQIQDVYPVSKDVVEFLIHVHPEEMQLKENPHVRQILLGEEKPKE